MASKIIDLDLNRVEGDLKISVEVDDNHVVTNAWSVGTMYRGFEQLLIGRAATDALVITPRICGICGTSHLYASVSALESALACEVPPNATRIRNICLMAENIQSDLRHAFLIYLVELVHQRYADNPDFQKMQKNFAPFEGKFYQEAITYTKKILEIVALFGGQWPHSSYMIPGGVTSVPSKRVVIKALSILDIYQRWFEQSIIGTSIENWLALSSKQDFEKWLESDESHRDSAIGLFTRFGRSIGLHKMGLGHGDLLSGGNYYDPIGYKPDQNKYEYLCPPGFYHSEGRVKEPFAQEHVNEHVRYSWFVDYDGGKHPWQGETIPHYKADSDKYSWAKAPRYKDKSVEVGPLADVINAGDPFVEDYFRLEGSNTWLRQLARFQRPARVIKKMRGQLQEMLENFKEPYYIEPNGQENGEGYGIISAARGSLGHWIEVQENKIAKYQVITPTSWNASPKDSNNLNGQMEQALVGTQLKDPEDPLEVSHIIRSHDPCLVCTVHFLGTKKKMQYST